MSLCGRTSLPPRSKSEPRPAYAHRRGDSGNPRGPRLMVHPGPRRGPPGGGPLSLGAGTLLGGNRSRLGRDVLQVLPTERDQRRDQGGGCEADADPKRDLEAARERGGLIRSLREQVLRPRGRDRGENGEPDRAADLLARVDEP